MSHRFSLLSSLKIYRRGAEDAKERKGEWVIEKNPVLLRVPLRPSRLCGKHLGSYYQPDPTRRVGAPYPIGELPER